MGARDIMFVKVVQSMTINERLRFLVKCVKAAHLRNTKAKFRKQAKAAKYKERNCKACERPFTPTSGSQKFCCPECKAKYLSAVYRSEEYRASRRAYQRKRRPYAIKAQD